MLKEEEVLLILYSTVTLLSLVFFVVIFFISFQKRKNKLLIEKFEAEKKFEKELAKSQIEIQEQTFKNIAWELHDNIGQLLSVANMQLGMVIPKTEVPVKEELEEAKLVVGNTLQEVRSLSKTLNNEVVLNNGLHASIEVELERFKRLKFLATEFTVQGTEMPLSNEVEIIVFRILQEFFSNTLKHSRAKKLFVNLEYQNTSLTVMAQDDGIGFDSSKVSTNSGLQNMKGRASIIGASFELISEENRGTQIQLTYPYPIYGSD
ncbi:MAG: histidine kinase [Flavobacteriaceae bacterium]